jgi:hypothetical protein
MPCFELKVKRADMPDILGVMREWLDQRKSNISHFRSESNGNGMVTINLGFSVPDDGEAFRRHFGQTANIREL